MNNTNKIHTFFYGDKIKIVHENGKVEYGEFHRYGQTRHGAIVFFNGIIRFVDEQLLCEA